MLFVRWCVLVFADCYVLFVRVCLLVVTCFLCHVFIVVARWLSRVACCLSRGVFVVCCLNVA